MCNKQLGIIMDSISKIKVAKDSSFAILLAAQTKGWLLWYMELHDIWLQEGKVVGRMQALRVQGDPAHWYHFTETKVATLDSLEVVLMRKDLPY